jgi:hypothetical protein
MPDNLLVDAIKTNFSEEQLVYALKNAWIKIYNQEPKKESLAILYAQIAVEIGRGKECYNWNLGNIKKTENHKYCMFRCSEIIDGYEIFFDPPHPQTHFNAYENFEDGIFSYLNFLSKRTRYEKAWQEVISGNPIKYSAALKVAGYYTASLKIYTNAIISLFNEFMKKADILLEWQPELNNQDLNNQVLNEQDKEYFKQMNAWSLDTLIKKNLK